MKLTSIKNILPLVFSILSTAAMAQTAFKMPPYTKFKLPDGLTVYLMEKHDVPLISISAVTPAGAIYDGDKHGLASLTANVLRDGTKSFTKAKLDEDLDFIGAGLNTYATKEYAGLSANFASKDLDKVLPIINEVLTAPSFNAEEFEKEKKKVLAGLDQAKHSPNRVIGAYWDHFIYGDQAYGNSTTGSPFTVGKLTVADLQAFYKANYAPDHAAFVVVGDFDPTIMKLKLGRMFSTWKKGATSPANPSANTSYTPSDTRVLLVNKDDARETTFLIGGPGIRRDNPDYVALQVVNSYFGGSFLSMLNEELRVNSGLTYGASSRFNALQNSGTFLISTFTALKTTEPAIDKAVEVLKKYHKEGISEKSLTSAKNYVKGQFPPQYETSGELAGLLTEMFWHGFNESFINDFEANVDKLDIKRANELIAKYYPADKLQFVLIGKSAEIKKIAEKYGKVTEKQIKDDGF